MKNKMIVNQMINFIIVVMVTVGALVVSLMGMGLFMLLPSSVKEKIAKFHEQ
jgi:hypothetical protein